VSDTRRRIVAEAMALCLAGGYGATSLRMIADRIGITQAAVYYHFRAKDDLLAELLNPLFNAFDEVLGEAEERARRERTVDQRALFGALFDCLREHRDAIRLTSGDVTVRQHPLYAPSIAGASARCQKLLSGPRDPLGATLADAALSVLTGAMSALSGRQLDQAREVLLDAAIRVLNTPRASPRARRRPVTKPPLVS
jgi:AcrR family transcriptional regulator